MWRVATQFQSILVKPRIVMGATIYKGSISLSWLLQGFGHFIWYRFKVPPTCFRSSYESKQGIDLYEKRIHESSYTVIIIQVNGLTYIRIWKCNLGIPLCIRSMQTWGYTMACNETCAVFKRWVIYTLIDWQCQIYRPCYILINMVT